MQAYVSYASNNDSAMGCLVLGCSIRRTKSKAHTCLLTSPIVCPPIMMRLREVFDSVVEVRATRFACDGEANSWSDVEMKLNCFLQVQFAKCVFLEYSSLVLENIDDLFTKEDFSAAPDLAWPDCFSSTVFVFEPSVKKFEEIINYLKTNIDCIEDESVLLNKVYSNWCRMNIKHHLPFIYNLNIKALKSYRPAIYQYIDTVRVVQFIERKPWRIEDDPKRTSDADEQLEMKFFLIWRKIYKEDVESKLYLKPEKSRNTSAEEMDFLAAQKRWQDGNIDYSGADSFENIQKNLDSCMKCKKNGNNS